MYTCIECKREFSGQDEFLNHFYMVEDGYYCPICHSSNVDSECDTNTIPYGDTIIIESHIESIQCMDCGHRF